jgi:hypothetical protein
MKAETGGSELFKRHEVTVCTGDCLFVGMIQCVVNQRLIDAINEGVPYGASARSVKFLPLIDTEVMVCDGEKKKLQNVYIAKGNIIFIARSEHEAKEKVLTTYPYRKKVSLRVKIFALPYTINGSVHVDTWGQLPDAIESDEMFFPLTDAEVVPALPGGHSHFDFMAVNRAKISYLCEES